MKAVLFVCALTLALGPTAFARGGGGGGHSHGGGSSHSSSKSYSQSTAHPGGSHSVSGYTRKDGTQVAPHHATNRDQTKDNNWTTKGNVNPHTGKPGTRNGD